VDRPKRTGVRSQEEVVCKSAARKAPVVERRWGLLFCCLNLVLNLFRLIDRARSFKKVATVSALNIKGIPADLIVLELNVGIKDCTATGAGVGRTNRT
jgi:hypothetical protein